MTAATVDLDGYRGKIRPEHAAPIVDAMRRVIAAHPDAAAAYAAEGLSPKRYRWDVFWCARRADPDTFNAAFDGIYTYADDTHVDTLLRYAVDPS